MGEIVELLFRFLYGLLEAAFQALVEGVTFLIKRAIYGADGTKPNLRRLFWFRVVDLLLAVHLGYGVLILVADFPEPPLIPLYAEPVVVISVIGFFFCFMVSLAGEGEGGNYRHVFLSILSVILIGVGLLAWHNA